MTYLPRVPGLGSRAVGDIVASMSEETGAGDRGETAGVTGVTHPLIKTETVPISQPPGLIPLPAQDAVSALSAEKQQVCCSISLINQHIINQIN